MIDTALLILNYNSQQYLLNCLQSLVNQNSNSDIYFIDNASTDDSVDFVKNNFPQIKIIQFSQNLGIGKAFNSVLKKIIQKYKFIGLFNPDIIVDQNWLKISRDFLQNNDQIYVCTSFTQSPDQKIVDTLGGTILNLPMGIFSGFLGNNQIKNVPSIYLKKPFLVFFGLMTGMLIKSSAFKECGFFDENYFMYFEDIDFCWRLLLNNKKICCHPLATIKHYGHGSVKNTKSQIFISTKSETNLLATYTKNLSFPLLIILLPITTIIRLFMSLFYLPISAKITRAKIIGILIFYQKLIKGNYNKSRSYSQSLRQQSDFQVFKNNPQSLINFKSVFKQMSPWLKHSNKYT